MTLKNDAKSKNAKNNVNNAEVLQNSSSGANENATVVDSNSSGNRNRAAQSRVSSRNRRSRNTRNSAITSSHIDNVGNTEKGTDNGGVIDNTVQASTTSLREDTVKRSNANDKASEQVFAKRNTQDNCTTVHVNDFVNGTQVGYDNADVESIAEMSTCQTGNETGEQHSIIPAQGEHSSISKGESINSVQNQNGQKEQHNAVAQPEVAAVPLKRSKRTPIRNNKYDIFFQEESIRSLEKYSNAEGSNRKKKKVQVQKNLVDNTAQTNCKVKKNSILSKEGDNVATSVNVSNASHADALGGNTNQLVNVKSLSRFKGNENVPQKPEHYYYSNVLGHDVLADAAANGAHHLFIPRVSYSTTDDNANRFSAPTSAINSIDPSSYDLSLVNQNMWTDPYGNGIVKANGEQGALGIVQTVGAVDLHSSVHGLERGKLQRSRARGKAGTKRGRGRDKLASTRMDQIEQQPYSINSSDLMMSEAQVFPNMTDQGGMAAVAVTEDYHQSVVAPWVDRKKRGRKKKVQISNAQEGLLDVTWNENAKEHKSSTRNRIRNSTTRRRSDVSFDMSNAPGDANTSKLYISPRASSVLEEKHLPHLIIPKVDINSSGVYRKNTSSRRKVKKEKNKEFLYSGNSALGVDTLAGTNTGNVVSASNDIHHQGQAGQVDYASGRNVRKRKCTERWKNGRSRKKSRGTKCKSSVKISTNTGHQKSGTANVLLGSQWTNTNYNKNGSKHCDSDNKRLFPNETFQIKEEFMNNVNSLNTVFNFNDEFLKFLKKISQVDDIDYDVMLPFLGEVQDKLAKDIKEEFPPKSLNSHNVDQSVYAMGYLVDILNNNNEILNKLNQLEYKFYYDYLRKKSCKEGNKQKNSDHKIDNESALNVASIPKDINNDGCDKIQSNHLDDDSAVKNQSSKNINEIDDEEERKMNELMYSANKEMDDDSYKIPTCPDMHSVNYKEDHDIHHINQHSMNLKNEYGTSTLSNNNLVGEKLQQAAPKCTDKKDPNVEKEKISKKIDDMKNKKNFNKNDFQFKSAHKLIKRNNIDFVCDELNKLIKHTLKNEDLFYSNYSQGKYKNVNEKSLFKHYISTQLYRTTNLVDKFKVEQKERILPSQKAFRCKQLGANEGVSIKVDEREQTLMQSYADCFRRLNDVPSRRRSMQSGRSGPAQLGYSTNGLVQAQSDSTAAMLSHADDNTNYLSTNLQVFTKTEPMDRLEKHERRNDDSKKKQHNNGFSSEEKIHNGPKGTDPQSANVQKEETQKKDEDEKKSFGISNIIWFFKKNVMTDVPVDNNNPDRVDGAVKKEADAELETHPSGGVGVNEKGLGDSKSKIDGENASASIKTYDEETKVCAPFEVNRNSLDISKCSEKDKPRKSATDVSLRDYGSGITEYKNLPRTGAHTVRHMNETREKDIDTLLKETFHLKDNELMSIKDKTQKEILNCLRMVSQIKKIFLDECSKMINEQIYVLERNFRIPDCSLSILKNSFGYNDGK
ncbi:hypothetical protein AK88_03444 [Plasmodium fragile]|uniref:Uncharacterized protein n=1 Tax=Plasmodium fragile TaxID=5857 RepID=A0A0D9QIN7_PLAFR|nr:uncharacterized protein AK88_03444 [Plasmodium fragile]KJP86935.1 hypothetical protein AK88_03444 [Plasmodium fragile]